METNPSETPFFVDSDRFLFGLRLEGFVEQYLLRYLGDYIFGVVAWPKVF